MSAPHKNFRAAESSSNSRVAILVGPTRHFAEIYFYLEMSHLDGFRVSGGLDKIFSALEIGPTQARRRLERGIPTQVSKTKRANLGHAPGFLNRFGC